MKPAPFPAHRDPVDRILNEIAVNDGCLKPPVAIGTQGLAQVGCQLPINFVGRGADIISTPPVEKRRCQRPDAGPRIQQPDSARSLREQSGHEIRHALRRHELAKFCLTFRIQLPVCCQAHLIECARLRYCRSSLSHHPAFINSGPPAFTFGDFASSKIFIGVFWVFPPKFKFFPTLPARKNFWRTISSGGRGGLALRNTRRLPSP